MKSAKGWKEFEDDIESQIDWENKCAKDTQVAGVFDDKYGHIYEILARILK
jgi:hypothetical protein